MNRSEIWSNIKRKLLGLKWVRNTTPPPPHKKREPQIGRGLFGVHLLILHFRFQFSKSIKTSTFHTFLSLTYPFRKNISYPKCPKITQIFTQNCQTVVNKITRGIWRCLKCYRDIVGKAVLSDVKTAFTCTPALKEFDLDLSFPPRSDTRSKELFSRLPKRVRHDVRYKLLQSVSPSSICKFGLFRHCHALVTWQAV